MKNILTPILLAAGFLASAQNTTDLQANAKTNVPKEARTSVNTGSRYDVKTVIGDKQPDVFLDVPNLSVDKIMLEVSKLDAHVSLDAKVANLVSLKAGVDASIDNVKLEIEGVQANLLLVVRLDNVKEIINKTLDTLDKNPQLVTKLLDTVDNTVGTVGNVANTALKPDGLLSQTVNTLGQTVNKTLDTTGNLVENTLDASGKILSSKNVGKLTDLELLDTKKGDNGTKISTYKDQSGATIEVKTDRAGKIISKVIKNQNF